MYDARATLSAEAVANASDSGIPSLPVSLYAPNVRASDTAVTFAQVMKHDRKSESLYDSTSRVNSIGFMKNQNAHWKITPRYIIHITSPFSLNMKYSATNINGPDTAANMELDFIFAAATMGV